MPSQFETVRLAKPAAHILQVTLDRPEVFNALNTQMGADLKTVWEELYRCLLYTSDAADE